MKDGRITRQEILARVDDRVIIMDGAMGTMLRGSHSICGNEASNSVKRKETIPPSTCLLNLTDPERVARIHRSYIQSGAELIGTNTFNSEAVANRGVNVYEINRAGAQIAFRVATEEGLIFLPGDEVWKEEWGPRRAIVAGSLVATSRNAAGYEQIAKGLLDGGADVLLLESIYDLANAEAALKGIRKAIGKRTGEIPVMVSLTIDMEGRILSGEDFRTVFGRLEKFGIFSLGFNCSMGAGLMIPLAIELAEFAAEYPVSLCPSAGLPDSDGHYPEDPEFWASCVGKMHCPDGTPAYSFAGGCCGTTPEYIRALKSISAPSVPKTGTPGAF